MYEGCSESSRKTSVKFELKVSLRANFVAMMNVMFYIKSESFSIMSLVKQ